MKYILALGIEFKKASKNFKSANISVSMNNMLIDTFSLNDDKGLTDNMISTIDDTWYRHFDKMHWLERDDRKENWKRSPKFYKTYLLDEDKVENNLEIIVDNTNSDYTNGFIKKSSLIRFHMIALVPVDFLKDNGKTMMTILNKLDDGYNKFLARRNIFPNPWEEANEKENELIAGRKQISWPTVRTFNANFIDKEFQTDTTTSIFSYIGGSFTTQIPIKTKHKIKYLGETQIPAEITTPIYGYPIGQHECLVLATCRPLLNICNED